MSYLTEAFKALNKLEEDTFDVSADGVKKLEDFLNDNDYVEDEIQIIDDNAEDFDELQKDYIGNVILDCNVCHSKIYKDESDITIDEESENANVGEQCPYCYSEEGFKVIGRIAPMRNEDPEDFAGLNEKCDKEAKNLTESLTEREQVKFRDMIDEAFLTIGVGRVNEEYVSNNSFLVPPNYGHDFTQDDFNKVKKLISEHLLQEDYLDYYYGFEITLNDDGKMLLVFPELKVTKPFEPDYADRMIMEEAIRLAGYDSRDLDGVVRYYKLGSGKDIYERNIEDEYKDLQSLWKKAINEGKTYKELRNDVSKYYKNIIESNAGKTEFNESVNLATKENTIAGVLSDNISKLKNITDVNELRNKAIEVVENSDIADKPSVAKFKRVLFTKKSLIALLSTIATYMTGIKTLKEHFGLKTLKEDLGDDIEKYQKWVDYDMKHYHRISDETNREVKEAGLQIVKDKYGDYEVISGPYKESLEESVEKVEVKTEESTTKVETEEDGSVKVTTEPTEKCEVEEKEEVIEPLTDEEKFDIEEGTDTDVEAEDFDEESFEELGESYLKEMYENVKSFKTTSKKMSGNTVMVEGLITFNTGKKAKTSFKFKSADCKHGSCRMLGENLSITKTPNAFVLNGKVENKKFINESLTYNYRAKNEQGKQHRYNGTVSRGVK